MVYEGYSLLLSSQSYGQETCGFRNFIDFFKENLKIPKINNLFFPADRGVCLPSLFPWALFIVFEYSVRYRFDNATWYLARTSWITAGLFPNTAGF